MTKSLNSRVDKRLRNSSSRICCERILCPVPWIKFLDIPCYNIIPRSILYSKYAKILYDAIYNGEIRLKVNTTIVKDDSPYVLYIPPS